MSGVIKVGAGVGMLIMPPVANWLIFTYGWRTSYSIIGIAVLVIMVSFALLLKRDPAQVGQLPDGEEEADAGHSNLADKGWSLREAFHARQFWMICGIYLVGLFCARTAIVHIAPHAMDLGISATNAANVLAAIGGVSIVGRPIFGSIGDRVGNRLAIIICTLMIALTFLWLQLAGESWMLYLFASLYGFAHGGFFTLISPWIAELFGMSSHGVIFGIVFFSGTIGGAIGPVLAGHIFDVTESYQAAFSVCAALCGIAFISVLFLRPVTKARS